MNAPTKQAKKFKSGARVIVGRVERGQREACRKAISYVRSQASRRFN